MIIDPNARYQKQLFQLIFAFGLCSSQCKGELLSLLAGLPHTTLITSFRRKTSPEDFDGPCRVRLAGQSG